MRFIVGGPIQVTAHRREEVKEVFQVDKPIQILVVSSEFTNCDVLKDIINREGWKMSCAANGSRVQGSISQREYRFGVLRPRLGGRNLSRGPCHYAVAEAVHPHDSDLPSRRLGRIFRGGA